MDTNLNIRQKFREARSLASAQCLWDSLASVQCLRIVRGTSACLPDSPRNNSPDQICVVAVPTPTEVHAHYGIQEANTLMTAPAGPTEKSFPKLLFMLNH